MTTRMVCTRCGSQNVTRDGALQWDGAKWIERSTYDNCNCENCEAEGDDILAELAEGQKLFKVTVRYQRGRHGIVAPTSYDETVTAPDIEQAIDIATARVRAWKTTIKIDGGDAEEITVSE